MVHLHLNYKRFDLHFYGFVIFACTSFSSLSVFAQAPDFRNERLSIDQRVEILLKELTLEEKISLLGNDAKGIKRLQIPPYNWWNEALHGVARAGEATIFPQAIGMAASFDVELIQKVADAISTEARAKYNLASAKNRRNMYQGLTFWSPNINIFRDPRWGRGQETYGEDPFLTATMGTAFVNGLQGKDSNFLKTAACAKHFVVHSGPENLRHGFDAIVGEKDLRETYLYAFERLVRGNVEAIMTAYNGVNGKPCSINEKLIKNILINEWKFDGHIVTDCGALYDILDGHKSLSTPAEVAAEAIKKGINIECGNLLQLHAMEAVQSKLIDVEDINRALKPAFKTQFKLGFFDGFTPYFKYGEDSISNDYHTALTLKMAEESMVLLKNDQNILPLDKSKYSAYLVLGPNAASLDALIGNYHGTSSNIITFVDGITKEVGKDARVEYDMGCDFKDTAQFGGIWAAGNADVSIVVLGLTAVYEGENGDAFLAENGADRMDLSLPHSHVAYLKALRNKTKTPLVVVITSGSAIDVEAISPYADAIILAWYPGEQGGTALANLLFGRQSPSGRLPVTFYKTVDDLPEYKDYSMKGRTYRYFETKPSFPFGFGMSYSSFEYNWKNEPVVSADSIQFSVDVKNSGVYDADEVVQVYVYYPKLEEMPIKELKSFARISLKRGQEKTVYFSIPKSELMKWDVKDHKWKFYDGKYKLVVGGHSEDDRLQSALSF